MSPTPETYSRHTAKALRLLKRYGSAATISRSVRDPNAPNYPGAPPAETVTTVYDVRVLDTGSVDGEIQGSAIATGTLIGLLTCAPDFTPSTADRISLAGDAGSYAIDELSPLEPAPGGPTFAYELVGKR